MGIMDASPVFDAYIESCEKHRNFAGRSYLSVGTQQECRHRTIMRFDLHDLPEGVSIVSAYLKIHVYSYCCPGGPKIFQIHRITEPYEDDKVNWHNQPYYDPVAAGQFVVGHEANQSFVICLTALARKWQLGCYPNYGLLIRAQNEHRCNLIGLRSTEFPDPGMRPVLEIQYESQMKVIPGVGPPDCDTGQQGDIYVDVVTGKHYFKQNVPLPAPVRAIPSVTGDTLQVGSTRIYTTIQAALAAANNGDRLLLDAETFAITNTIDVNKSVTIEGQGAALTTVIATTLTPSPFFMFNVTVSDVVFRNMTVVQDYPRSAGETDTVIAVNNVAATGIFIDNCKIGVSEIGLGMRAAEFQVTNCNFFYAPNALPNNNYACMLVSSCPGDSIVHNNTFVSGARDVGCYFIRMTNAVSPGFTGRLVVSHNLQTTSPFTLRHLLAIEEYTGQDFQLFINDNQTIYEGNVPVLLFNPDLSMFRFLQINGNTVQNTAGKGLAGIDSGFTGTTSLYSSNNTIVDQSFAPGWSSATVPPGYIVGYRTTIVPAPVISQPSCYWLPLI